MKNQLNLENQIKEVKQAIEIAVKQDKVQQFQTLKKIEQEHYKPLIKQLAYTKDKTEQNALVEVFIDLARLTLELGHSSNELKYFTDAAVCYQYAITILEEKLSIKNHDLYGKLNEIKTEILRHTGGNSLKSAKDQADDDKGFLKKLRQYSEKAIKEVESYRAKQDEKSYVDEARKLFEQIAADMKKFLAHLYQESEKEIGYAPCKYSVIGLGSMSLNQMTPYSDLEFAILIQNYDPKIVDYFRNLTHLVHFKMINLGETIIPTSKYGVDLSHLVHRAVNFDLGGKTPLGRIDKDKPYDLIGTVDWLLKYVKNEGDKASHIDKSLPYILEKVCYVHGDEQLVQDYQTKVSSFLHGKDEQTGNLQCEQRAMKILTEGAVEIDYLGSDRTKQSHFKGDIEKLQPLDPNDYGKLFDVKQEIYRLPDRLLYNLGLYYGIQGEGAWDTIDQLNKKDIINAVATNNLKYAATFATTLRLNTYLYSKGQKENLSIFPNFQNPTVQSAEIFRLSPKDLEEGGSIFQYFYVVLPFYKKLKEVCDQSKNLCNENKDTFFLKKVSSTMMTALIKVLFIIVKAVEL